MASSLLTNLVAYYKLDELSGNPVDSSGNGFNLVNNGTTTYTQAMIANGADFGATNTTKSLTITQNLGITGGNITMTCWVKMNTEIGSGEQYFMFQESATNRNGYDITYSYNGGSRQILFRRLRKGVVQGGYNHSITLGTSNYYHLGLTYSSSTITAYVNGVSVGTASQSGAGTGGTTFDRFAIGASYSDNTISLRASAIIDEVGVWSRALTAAEMLEDFKNGAANQHPFNNSGFFFRMM